jgi:teichuronic acid biosynthesis glycosyltransferase TuaC
MEITEQEDHVGRRQNTRVLYVIPGTEEGTSMSFSRRQAESVSPYDIEVKSFYLRSRTSPIVVWKELQRLRVEIRTFAPQVVHAHFGTMTALVATIASPVPVVITFHGSDLNPAPRVSWLRSKLGRTLSHLAARRADQVICVSSQLGQRLSYMKQRTHVIPCGVNTDRFRPESRNDCRAQLGWSKDEVIVLFNARTDPRGKRLDLAEATVRHAKGIIPNLRMHVFRGTTHPDEMPKYYSAANALLMTSDYEGSPMVVKEAMACNLPVVSVDVGDVAERLDGVFPSAVVARDARALGNALVEVIQRGKWRRSTDALRARAADLKSDRLLEPKSVCSSSRPTRAGSFPSTTKLS